jgi:membrane associated rhomboid family serine protease
MIPLRDASTAPVRFPVVTVSVIAISVLAFGWEVGSGEAAIIRRTVVPAELMRGQGWIPPLTAVFLHGGVMDVISLTVFLAAFAPMVEDAMGRGRLLVFYILGGLAATAAQVVVDPASTVPQLGASGVIAAVRGGFLVTYPGDRIEVLGFFGLLAHDAHRTRDFISSPRFGPRAGLQRANAVTAKQIPCHRAVAA